MTGLQIFLALIIIGAFWLLVAAMCRAGAREDRRMERDALIAAIKDGQPVDLGLQSQGHHLYQITLGVL